ncbi:hypothetical protein D3C78_19140 [compost metagenome]
MLYADSYYRPNTLVQQLSPDIELTDDYIQILLNFGSEGNAFKLIRWMVVPESQVINGSQMSELKECYQKTATIADIHCAIIESYLCGWIKEIPSEIEMRINGDRFTGVNILSNHKKLLNALNKWVHVESVMKHDLYITTIYPEVIQMELGEWLPSVVSSG